MVEADSEAAAATAAREIARECRGAIALRGRAVLAVSGGETPWRMLRALLGESLDWSATHVAQVDERVVPRGDSRRNLTRLETILVREGPLAPDRLIAMPVEEPDLDRASSSYQARLEGIAGRPPRFDLVHLGLGEDGHTASLVPRDPVLDVLDREVAVTAEYGGLRRMTLTYAVLGRARRIVWLVTGAAKGPSLSDLVRGRGDAPAVRVPRADAVVVADAAAASAAGLPDGVAAE